MTYSRAKRPDETQDAYDRELGFGVYAPGQARAKEAAVHDASLYGFAPAPSVSPSVTVPGHAPVVEPVKGVAQGRRGVTEPGQDHMTPEERDRQAQRHGVHPPAAEGHPHPDPAVPHVTGGPVEPKGPDVGEKGPKFPRGR